MYALVHHVLFVASQGVACQHHETLAAVENKNSEKEPNLVWTGSELPIRSGSYMGPEKTLNILHGG